MADGELDLGHGHALRFTRWGPDRELNPHRAHLPDVDRCGAIVEHQTPAGEPCAGAVLFDDPVVREVFSGRPVWQVESWDPLTISPSVLCSCGDHGFVRGGRWVPA